MPHARTLAVLFLAAVSVVGIRSNAKSNQTIELDKLKLVSAQRTDAWVQNVANGDEILFSTSMSRSRSRSRNRNFSQDTSRDRNRTRNRSTSTNFNRRAPGV